MKIIEFGILTIDLNVFTYKNVYNQYVKIYYIIFYIICQLF